MWYPTNSSENSSTKGGKLAFLQVTALSIVAELMSQYLPNFFFLIRNQIFRYNPFESFRIPLSKQSCTIFITSKLIFKVARNLMLAISYAKSSLKLLKKKHLCGIVYT